MKYCYLKEKCFTLGCYCSVVYGRLFLISHFFFICFSASFGSQWEIIHKHIAKMNIIIWQGKSECSDWFFLGQDFAIWTISCAFFVFESQKIQNKHGPSAIQ